MRRVLSEDEKRHTLDDALNAIRDRHTPPHLCDKRCKASPERCPGAFIDVTDPSIDLLLQAISAVMLAADLGLVTYRMISDEMTSSDPFRDEEARDMVVDALTGVLVKDREERA